MNIIQAFGCQKNLISSSILLQHLSHGLSSQQEPGSPMGKPLFPSLTRETPNGMMTQQLAMCEGHFTTYIPRIPSALNSLCLTLPSALPPLLWAAYLTVWVTSRTICMHHQSRRGAGDMQAVWARCCSCLSG